MRRYVETFERSPWLFAIPLVVLTVVGLLLAARAAAGVEPFRAKAMLAVNLDPNKTRPPGELPPSDHHAEFLGELMQSDTFVAAALERTALHADPAQREISPAQLREVRRNWQHRAVGPNTIEVSYRCSEPGLCAEVVAAVLAAYQDEVVAARVAAKKAAVDY